VPDHRESDHGEGVEEKHETDAAGRPRRDLEQSLLQRLNYKRERAA
jgi:hypothetical protein